MPSATEKLVIAALAHTEALLAAEYLRLLTVQFDTFATQLEADGWDAEKSFAYPSSSYSDDAHQIRWGSRAEYHQALARRDYCQAHSKSDKAKQPFCRSFKDPDFRVIDRAEEARKIKVLADKTAKAALAGFCTKLAGKIDATLASLEDVTAVKYEGGLDPWGWSFVHVTIDDSRKQS